jgi:hypothetical protein
MPRSVELQKLTGTASRLASFVVERYPLALDTVLEVLEAVADGRAPLDEAGLE